MDPSEFEELAGRVAKTPAERAAVDRVSAGLREVAVARFRLEVVARDTSIALDNFMAKWRAAEERMVAREADEVAEHPDLAEMNVVLDSFYTI